jgi:dienelactone hydrolase
MAQEAERLDGAFLAGVKSRGGWQKLRPRLHQQYLDMLGLWPLPEHTPLKATVTGTLERDSFVVEKLHFQSLPRLYVTGNLYRPKQAGGRLPAVLYVCGHSNRGRDGNKSAYQHHGMWFATHGYVCLIIDSLQLGEVAGIHHGTYRYNRWWWHSRGYTPAGVECWNSMRALDYLQSRPEVDPERLAVTGISGGGACSFWLAAADERVKAAVPVSGMGDLDVYVTDRVVDGHCDCMFLYDCYQWPWTHIAALVAPRPLLFANSDHDTIFPMDGNDRVIARLRKLYGLLGKPELVDAVVAPGGHDDKPELRLAAYQWINKHLKGDASKVDEPTLEPFKGEELRVFPDTLPEDELNSKIDETFVPLAKADLPKNPKALQAWRKQMLADLRSRCFAGWPAGKRVQSSKLKAQSEEARGELVTEAPIRVAWHSIPGAKPAKTWWLVVLNEDETDDAIPEWAKDIVGGEPCVLLSPRGVGATAWTVKPPFRIARSMALLGRTVDSGRVWDVMAFARSARGITWKACGRGQAGIIAAYAALFEPSLTELVLVEPPASHASGPCFLGVMRVTDIAQSLGLLAPRPLTLRGADATAFDITSQLYGLAGAGGKLRIGN